jgi:hypothetical protein
MAVRARLLSQNAIPWESAPWVYMNYCRAARLVTGAAGPMDNVTALPFPVARAGTSTQSSLAKEHSLPINLTQEFTFETDAINNFTTILTAVMPILFGPSCRLEQSGQDNWPSESAAWFLSRDREAGQRTDEGARFLHWPVCTLSTAYGKEPNCLTPEAALNETIRHLREANVEEFRAHCGQRGPFARADGSVRIGFRMHWSTSKGEELRVSLCHIFYSK